MKTKLFLQSILPLAFEERINAANQAFIPLDELLAQSDALLKRTLGVRRSELKVLKQMYVQNGWTKMSSFFNSTVIEGDRMVDYGFITTDAPNIQDILDAGVPLECVNLESENVPLEKLHKAIFFSGVNK